MWSQLIHSQFVLKKEETVCVEVNLISDAFTLLLPLQSCSCEPVPSLTQTSGQLQTGRVPFHTSYFKV